MLYLFIALIVLVLLMALMGSWNSGAEDNGVQNAGADVSSNDAAYNHPYTQDDIIYKDGSYYENENSEDWEEFEYEISEDERFK